MGEVIVTFKVMPESTEADLGRMEGDIKKAISPDRIEREPIAFGLVALKVTKIIPDAGGVLGEIENKLNSIEDVGEVEVVEIGRSL